MAMGGGMARLRLLDCDGPSSEESWEGDHHCGNNAFAMVEAYRNKPGPSAPERAAVGLTGNLLPHLDST